MIKSNTYYYVVCDNCGRRADYGVEHESEAWRTPDNAVDLLPAFWTTNGRHHCPRCPPLEQEPAR